ncbi:MAG: response regulator [Desulfamplus sp.]|nr:response regulator [Desulfamplus sp.]
MQADQSVYDYNTTNYRSNIWLDLTALIAVILSLYGSSLYSYLLFHNISELFSIMIAFALFIVSWNTKEYTEEPNLVYLGIAYLFVGIIDLFHTLAYKGMNVFTDYPFYANQLWVGARYLESITLLIFAFLTKNAGEKNIANPKFYYLEVMLGYGTITSLILLSVFYWKIFPVCFVQEFEDGRGYQTQFKIISGYMVILILTITASILYRKRLSFNASVYKLLMWSMAATIGSEFCFTLYISNYGASNQIGHFLKIVSFYMLYRAIIATGLRNPFQLMFKRLKENENQLLIERDRAEAASRTKSSFLANMSHELRTPLNGILGYTQILKRRSEATTFIKNGLNIIEQSGQHLLTLINDILDLSKIEAGKMEILPVEFNLYEFLHNIVGIIRMRAELKDVSLSAIFDNALPQGILADETRLRQVLLNLLGNAVKFTDSGGAVTISVALKKGSDNIYANNGNRASIIFKITDTGIGMINEQKEHLFQPFEQVGESSRRVEGTGLGLAISQQLVELMGGKIEVKSEHKKGSTFWFEVDFPTVEISSFHLKSSNEKNITGYNGEPQRVLIVDDDLENRMVLVNMLEPIGFVVYVAENGSQALDMVDKVKPDIVLTDLVMPVMNGFEFVNALRRKDIFKNIPILAVSASTYPLDESESLRIGCNGFLPKPVDYTKLLECISKQLQIEWIYQDNNNLNMKNLCYKEPQDSEIVFPPKQELERLYELAVLGKILQIEEFTERIKSMDSKYCGFADKIRSMAAAFEDEHIVMFVADHLNKSNAQ